jgi:hypothetical protein
MVFNAGTGVNGHIGMLDKLIEVVTSRNCTSVAVNAGGTGYVVGDILTIDNTGATQTEDVELEVTSVSAGVITGIRVYRGGAYTVDPTTTTGNSTSGGTGSSATVDITMSAPTWTLHRRSQEAVSATVGAGGTGYSVSDQLTVTLGDGVSGDQYVAAVFNVDTVSAGAVTGVSLVTAGNYEEVPTNDVAVTGGGGSGAQLTVTWQDTTEVTQEFAVAHLEGEGSGGTDAIHVGIKAYSLVVGFDTAYNWALHGFTGYTATLPYHQQPGVNTDQINTGTGALPTSDDGNAIMVLKGDDVDPDIAWWIHHTGRRIVLICRVESGTSTIYSSCYLGFLNQLANDSEYAYPLCILSGTTDKDRLWSDTSLLTGGIVESISSNTGEQIGPGFIKRPGGTWMGFRAESSTGAGNRTLEDEHSIYPFINRGSLSPPNLTVSPNGSIEFPVGIIPSTGVPGSPTVQLKPTPGSGDDYYWLVSPIIGDWTTQNFPTEFQLYGELDGVYWFSTGNNAVVSEDRFELGTKRYMIFQNGNRTQEWSYFAIDED